MALILFEMGMVFFVSELSLDLNWNHYEEFSGTLSSVSTKCQISRGIRYSHSFCHILSFWTIMALQKLAIPFDDPQRHIVYISNKAIPHLLIQSTAVFAFNVCLFARSEEIGIDRSLYKNHFNCGERKESGKIPDYHRYTCVFVNKNLFAVFPFFTRAATVWKLFYLLLDFVLMNVGTLT